MNLASRIEGLAEPGTTWVTSDTFRLTEGLFRFEYQGKREVKGKAEPVQVYEVQGIKPRAFLVPTRGVEGVEIRMIGRDAELGRLQDALYEVMEAGEAWAITISGEAGVGKTAIAEGLAQRIVRGDVPEGLKRRRLLALDLGLMLAGAKLVSETILRTNPFGMDPILFALLTIAVITAAILRSLI